MASSPIVFRKHLSSYIYTNDGVISRGNGKRLLHEFDDSELRRDLALEEEKILGTVGCVRSGETFGGRKTFRQVRERTPKSGTSRSPTKKFQVCFLRSGLQLVCRPPSFWGGSDGHLRVH